MLWRTIELVNAPPRNVITATLIDHHWDTSAELQCYTTQPLPTVSQVALTETTTNCQWWWFGECIAPGSITAIPGPAKREGHRGWYSRGYLPHLDAGQLLQFITFRLHDSVPSELIQQWKRQLGWHKDLPKDCRIKLKLNKRIEAYADKGAGACYLRDPRIARLVQQALEYFDRQRYHLIAWCIMPNHVHVLIKMLATPLEKILQSWKSYTAKKANKLLGRKVGLGCRATLTVTFETKDTLSPLLALSWRTPFGLVWWRIGGNGSGRGLLANAMVWAIKLREHG